MMRRGAPEAFSDASIAINNELTEAGCLCSGGETAYGVAGSTITS